MRTPFRRNQVSLRLLPSYQYLLSRECILAPVFQDKISPLRSHRPSSTSIASSCACSLIYTMHTTLKFFTCVPNRTSIRSLRTSSHSVVSTSCWTSRMFAAHPTRPLSALALSGSAGEKWAYLSLDIKLCRTRSYVRMQDTWLIWQFEAGHETL
jgi:hypothetical protein